MARRKDDPKIEALRQQGCLHPHPEKVTDELFAANTFFDPRDLLQVKYEMLRRVREGDYTISLAAARFGLSRPSFYQAQAAYEAGGLPALLPQKPGPRRAHKLSEDIVDALREMQNQAPDINAAALAGQLRERFGISVHPRSIERALARRKKNTSRKCGTGAAHPRPDHPLRDAAGTSTATAIVGRPTGSGGLAVARSGRLVGAVVKTAGPGADIPCRAHHAL